MEAIFTTFHQAQYQGSGPLLASTLSPIPPSHDPLLLRRFHQDSNVFSIKSDIQRYVKIPTSHLPKPESNAWIDIYVAYWKAIGEILRAESGHHRGDWAIKVYEAWKEVTNLLIRGFSNAGFGAWCMPCLYTAGKYLRVFAIKADEEKGVKVREGSMKMDEDVLLADDVAAVGHEKNERLEDAARLNSISLSKNCLRALQAAKADMPPMDAFPKSHSVTFRYYVGVIQFLDEEYSRAEENLTAAWHTCHKSSHRNKDLLLTYLIPTHLHTTLTLPTLTLLSTSPHLLSPLFSPLTSAIRSGSLSAFTSALREHESAYVHRRIYLSLERARDLCLRNLLRRVWLLQGGKGSTRVKVGVFGAGVRWSMGLVAGGEGAGGAVAGPVDDGKREAGEGTMEDEEVECLIAGMIYKNLLKGYISHEHSTVVLSRKGDAFPGTGV
ncbi:MAG: hypothetical protein Q9219_006370 [cf. Caloplaca sp. 3 TL-2023]